MRAFTQKQPTFCLLYQNEQKLNETIKILNEKDDNSSLVNWEQQNNFISMYTIFNKIVEDELIFSDSIGIKHSELLIEYPNSIVMVPTEDGCNFCNINIFSEDLPKVTNADGLVAVGNKVYMYAKEKIKIIHNGDCSKIPQLYTIVSSHSALGIEVLSVNSGTSSFHRECSSVSNKLKIIVYEDFMQSTSSVNTNLKATEYVITVRSLKKRLFGAWYDNYKTNITLTGNHVGNVTYGYLAD